MPNSSPSDFACLAAAVCALAMLSYFCVGGTPLRSPIPPKFTPDRARHPISAVLSSAIFRCSIAPSGLTDAQFFCGNPKEQTDLRLFFSSSSGWTLSHWPRVKMVETWKRIKSCNVVIHHAQRQKPFPSCVIASVTCRVALRQFFDCIRRRHESSCTGFSSV